MTSFRRSLAVITCLVLISGGAPGLFAESSAAAITGVILDPEGKPAFGFKVVFRDVASNTRFTSGPTDASGNYALEVPLGGRYKIESVVASDGVTKLAVQEIPPISVLTPGTTRLNVRFTNASPPSAAPAETAVAAKAAPTAPAPAPATATAPATAKVEPAEKKKKSAVPWYKRPGPITGMVIGGVAIVALAVGGGGGGGGGVASQSTPSQ
jgi:hypothetical protein